jgi:lipoic acid synthetase
MDLIQIEPARKSPAPKPEWLKARAPVGENYHDLKRLARSLALNTVCESAPTSASAGTIRPPPS